MEGGGVGPEKVPRQKRSGCGGRSAGPGLCHLQQGTKAAVGGEVRHKQQGYLRWIRLDVVNLEGPDFTHGWRNAGTGSNTVGQRRYQSLRLPPWCVGQEMECKVVAPQLRQEVEEKEV